MSLKRIVIVHDRIEARGGATGLARLSALEYAKKGYKVTYVTGARDDSSLADYGIETIALAQQDLASGYRAGSVLSGVYNNRTVKEIGDWISMNDSPDTAYHLHNWAQILSPSVFQALRAVAPRTVVSCHDFFNVCPNGGLLHFPSGKPCELKPMSAACWASQCDKRGPLEKYWRMVRHITLNRVADFDHNAMTFVCLHDGMEKIMREAGFQPRMLHSIANPARAYSNVRVEAEKNDTFIYVGRLNEEKGADLAVAAAQEAGVPLTLIGEGDLLERQSDAPANVKFAGFCSREQIVEYAQKARAIVLPGRWREPFGLVIAEAALSGIPVIISKPSSLASRVSELGFGDVFNPHSDGELVGLLRTWAEDDDRVKAYSEAAFSQAAQICNTPEQWAQKFIELMTEKVQLATEEAAH